VAHPTGRLARMHDIARLKAQALEIVPSRLSRVRFGRFVPLPTFALAAEELALLRVIGMPHRLVFLR